MFYRNLADKMKHISETVTTYNSLLQEIKEQATKGTFMLYKVYDKRTYFEILPVIIDRLEENGFEVEYKESLRNISEPEKIMIVVKWINPKPIIVPLEGDNIC